MEAIFTPISLSIFAIGLGVIGLAVGFYTAFQGKNEISERLRHFIESPSSSLSVDNNNSDGGTFLSRFRRQFNLVFAVLKSEEMQRQLVAANWPITESEYFFIRIGVALLSFLLGLLITKNIFPGLGLAIIGYVIPGFFLFRGIQARQKLFQNQLIDSLTLIRGAVEAGYSFQQSLNVVIQELDPPTSEEFRQVRKEVELGLPLNRALNNMASRMESDDFYLVTTAVNINMQVGGNLITILNVVIETIRQRVYLFSELRSLTSYVNFASYLLTLLPFFTIAVLSILSPIYWERLLQPGITRYMLIYAVCSLIIGNYVLRRMAKIQV